MTTKEDKEKLELLEKTMKGFSTEKKIRFLKTLLRELNKDKNKIWGRSARYG